MCACAYTHLSWRGIVDRIQIISPFDHRRRYKLRPRDLIDCKLILRRADLLPERLLAVLQGFGLWPGPGSRFSLPSHTALSKNPQKIGTRLKSWAIIIIHYNYYFSSLVIFWFFSFFSLVLNVVARLRAIAREGTHSHPNAKTNVGVAASSHPSHHTCTARMNRTAKQILMNSQTRTSPASNKQPRAPAAGYSSSKQ